MRVAYVVRGNGAEINASKTACPRGHPFDAGNTIKGRNGRSRMCRQCHRAQNRASMARRRRAQRAG